MRRITILIIIISVFSVYSEDSVKVKKNFFHIGLARSSLYGKLAGNTSFDRLIKNGIFSIGIGFDGANDISFGKYTFEPNLRVCFRPFKILDSKKLSIRNDLDPYIVFTPVSIIFTKHFNSTDDYEYSNNPGLAFGLNYTINRIFGLWTEYGISEHVRGAGGVLLQF